MIEIKPIGAWDQIQDLMRFRRKRWEALFSKASLDIAKEFRKSVIKNIPTVDYARDYKKSITIRRMLGAKDFERAYAVISEPKEVALSDIDQKRNVLYIFQTGEAVTDLGAYLEEYSPFVPKFFAKHAEGLYRVGGIRLINRRVTEDEYSRVAEKNLADYEGNKDRLRGAFDAFNRDFRAELKAIKEQEKKPEVKTMPDWMFMALRMEFGIGGKHHPHWSKAVKEIPKMVQKLSKKNGKLYSKYMASAKFKDWTMKQRKLKGLSIEDFKSKYLRFQEKVTG